VTPSRSIVITGAAGRLGTYLRSSLDNLATSARLVDIIPAPEAAPDEPVEIYQGSVTDPRLLDAVKWRGYPTMTGDRSRAFRLRR
jgi:nucleoside-diphosphate-sugar epimerase